MSENSGIIINHMKSFRTKKYEHNTALSSYVWKIKNETDITPMLKW